ncbi:MAG: DnaJ domain-containing protein [Nitrospirae bacterium]|nr:DnaJ domain-containing protein [Nitrospirota bacterium]
MVRELPLSGKFRDERLPNILTHLQRQKKTGVLVIWRNDQHKSIFIKDGDIIFAASKYQDDWLGEVLLKLGKITFQEYEAASEVIQTTRKRFGTVLVEQGALTAKDLFWAVTHQVKEIILSLFTWLDGEYRFEEGPLPAQEVITLKMSTANLILDGVRRINDFTRLRNELPPMNTILRMTTDPMILFQDIRLTENERKALTQIDGRKTLSEIFAVSGLPAFETLKLLYFFLSIGLVEAAVAERRPEPSFQEAAATEELVKEVKREQQEAIREAVAGDHEAIFQKDEASVQTTKQKIREAYEALQHQDYYEVLGLRTEATRDEIKRAYFRLAKEYHPDRHFQSGLEDLTPNLEALFRRITEAYDTLLMERKRKEYDTERAMRKSKGRREEPSAPSPAAQAQRGQQALQKGDLKTAAYHFEVAVKAEPDKGEYHALLAKALTQVPGRQRDAETHYKRAIELEPAAVSYYIGLGLLYIKGGMTQRAQRQFEEALIWDPDNKTAKEELKKLKES